MMRFLPIGKIRFYILSFTWGLPVTISGCIIALLFLITGHKPKRFGYCFRFESKRLKGGCSAGVFIFSKKDPSSHLLCHEHGHGVQNCLYGPLMPFLVSIPSSTRYHYRNLKYRITRKPNKTPYESIWFESQATKLGKWFENKNI